LSHWAIPVPQRSCPLGDHCYPLLGCACSQKCLW
jgi:hypothetical protein